MSEEALNHLVNNDMERDTEHETRSKSIVDTDTEAEIQGKLEAEDWNRFKDMGMK